MIKTAITIIVQISIPRIEMGVATLGRRSSGRDEALLVFFDVEGPVAIKVPAQVDSSELDDGLGHLLSPAHSRTLHAILDEILACTLDGATGDRPTLGEIFVITHACAIAVLVVRNAAQRFALGSEEPAFGDVWRIPLTT